MNIRTLWPVSFTVPLVFEEEPIPFDPTVKLRPEVLYVCNTERLERNVLFTYFALYNVQSIERLSKTSCTFPLFIQSFQTEHSERESCVFVVIERDTTLLIFL